MDIKAITSFNGFYVYLVIVEGIFDVRDFCEELGIEVDRYSKIEAQSFVKGNKSLVTVLVPEGR